MKSYISIHDASPYNLVNIETIISTLQNQYCINKICILVIPGLNWNKEHLQKLKGWQNDGIEIAAHGWNHKRPLEMDKDSFYHDLIKTKETIENNIGSEVIGYRAPCFSLDRQRLDLVEKSGFEYDSSRIDFSLHPLYGTIKMDDYLALSNNIFRRIVI